MGAGVGISTNVPSGCSKYSNTSQLVKSKAAIQATDIFPAVEMGVQSQLVQGSMSIANSWSYSFRCGC